VGGQVLPQGALLADEQQAGDGGHGLAPFPAHEPQGSVQLPIVEAGQGPVASVPLHRPSQALALDGIEVARRRPAHRQCRVVEEPEVGLVRGHFVGKEGDALGDTVGPQPAPLKHPGRRRHEPL
jgi:hypothetical protein